ncbi:MAG: CBS domain-containing protein [Lachnospiraceae bacterium]|nr:CBS domain-containing protein [Lachnospiraceae bacterium]
MLEDCLLRKDNTVKEAIDIFDEKKVNSVFIVDDNNVLLGIFTRGDLRQFILGGGEIHDSLENAMNSAPITFKSAKEAKIYSQSQRRVVYPIVNQKKQLVDVLHNTYDVFATASNSKCMEEMPVVIMAGGLGTRLYPLTKVLPKALIPIGDDTIMERIVRNFRAWGCKEFYFILNHKADMIKAYFDELDKDYTIHYIKEDAFLGTGGGLSLLKGMIDDTFILTNCDILVNADFECILKKHYDDKNVITFIGAVKNIEIPYGVLETDNSGKVVEFKEKPGMSFLTNTGVYIIEPEVIDELQKNRFCHITDIAEEKMHEGKRVGVFPITEKAWLDMGQFDEIARMRKALGIEGDI